MPTTVPSALDNESLQLISTINANRHKLAPEDQQAFDAIIKQIGAKNVPGTVANTAMQRKQQRDAQSTVPPPEDPNAPGPVRRFLQSAGVPTSVPELRDTLFQLAGPSGPIIATATGHPIPNPVVSAFNAIGSGMGDQAGQALDAAQHHDVKGYIRHSLGTAVPLVGPQMAEGNIAGGLGTAAALFAPTAAGKLSDALALRRSTVPIRTTVEAPPPGPVRRLIGKVPGFGSTWQPGDTRTMTTRVPLSSITDAAGGTASVQPIRPRPVPAFNPRNPTVFRGATEDTSLSPPTISTDFEVGNAPNQPLIQPRTIGPDFDPRSSGGRFAPIKSIPLVGDRPASTVPIDGFGPSTQPSAVGGRVFRTTNGATSEVPQSQWMGEQRLNIVKDAEGAGRMNSTVPSSVSPSPVSSPSPSTVSASATDDLVGQSVRFSRGNSRAHGTVVSVRGDVARVKNASGMSVRIPVSQLTILQKPSAVSP